MTDGPTLTIAGEGLCLFPERAVYWPRKRTLIVADTHWGKEETFRAAAIPLPPGTFTADLRRLTAAIARQPTDRLLVLGDLWHAKEGMANELMAELAAWRALHPDLTIQLVRGNHDRFVGHSPGELGIEVCESTLIEPPFAFKHHPSAVAGSYVMSGHLHPAAVLSGRGKQRLKLPCFWFGPTVGVLPAFGGFTGTAVIKASEGDVVFVLAEGEVMRVM